MTLSEELEDKAGTVTLILPEWVERARRLERIVESASAVHRELSLVAMERPDFWNGTRIE